MKFKSIIIMAFSMVLLSYASASEFRLCRYKVEVISSTMDRGKNFKLEFKIVSPTKGPCDADPKFEPGDVMKEDVSNYTHSAAAAERLVPGATAFLDYECMSGHPPPGQAPAPMACRWDYKMPR